jgi:phage terminase small subunit
MAGNGRQRREAILIANLAAGDSIREAAAKAGVSERTAHRRMKDPAFRQSINETWSELVREAVGRLGDAATHAANVLRELLNADSETVRLSAARSILDHTVRLSEFASVDQRLSHLESVMRLNEKK